MNGAAEELRLPRSVGGLLTFALRAWAANAPLYLLLALGVFAAYAVAEFALPLAALSTPQGQFKEYVLQFTSIFADAFVIAAVSLGIAARGAGAHSSTRALLGGAVERWLPVIAAGALVAAIQILTAEPAGFASSLPRALLYLTAPITWILWGLLGLTQPVVALSAEPGALAFIMGFGRAFSLGLRRQNFVRLCVLSLIVIMPSILEFALLSYLEHRHIPRGFFWANAPLDAITIGPVNAIAAAFALDFARRASAQRSSGRDG